MKKLTLMIAVFVFSGLSLLFAQTVVITGTVTSSVQGEGPIPGVSVIVKGTTIGTTTNVDGAYTLTVPETATTLLYQFIGMVAMEESINGRTTINMVMEPDVLGIDEVVVTSGYGIVRAPKGSAALNQTVTGDKLNEVRQTSVNNALAGKVAGIQVRSQSAMKLTSNGSIRLRGADGFGGGSGILYVVDGTVITNAGDINMDEVENINVLSGPAASAILGAQGANGAIIITTKKAKSYERGIGIEMNIGFQYQLPAVTVQYQNEYTGGSYGDLVQFNYDPASHPDHWATLDGKYYHDYSDDTSWGPRMVGQEYIPWYAWYEGTEYTGKTATLDPQPNNAKDFWEKGAVWNNSIAFSKATEDFNLRVVVSDVSVNGMIPTTYMDKQTLSVRSDFKLGEKWKVGANVNFNTTFTEGQFSDGYANNSSGSFNQWFHRHLDMDIMKELQHLQTPDGIYASWNHNNPGVYTAADNGRQFYAGNYWYNPYTYFNQVSIPRRADRLFGDLSLSYQIMDGLSAKVTYRRQTLSYWNESKYNSELEQSGTQTGERGSYSTSSQYTTRQNVESLLNYSKKFGDIAVNANAGSDFFTYIHKQNGASTSSGLLIDNLFTTSNSVNPASISNGRSQNAYNAVFLRGDIGFRDFLFAEFTVRNDWYSQLPPDNNSILSKSFGGAFVFSDLVDIPFMTFGKIRAGWGEIPTGIGTYQYPGFSYGVNQYQYNGNFLMGTPNRLVDPNISGAVKTQKEIGLEMRFLQDRVSLSATYWDGTTNNMPYSVSVSPYSGFTSKLVNTGQIDRMGLDVVLNLKPVRSDKFSWDINATFAYLIKNEVVSIADGIDRIVVETYWGTGRPHLVHAEGEPWGQIYGGGILRNDDGDPILTSSGNYQNDPNVFHGNVLPDFTGGIQNSIRFLNNFTLVANIDYQFGGKFYSLSDQWGAFSGLTARTGGKNDKGNPVRTPVADGGGVRVDGVINTGTPEAPIYEDATFYVEGRTYYQNLYGNRVCDEFVYDMTYVKLREVSFGYNLPVAKIGFLNNYITSARFSVVANNLILLYAKTTDIDPSEVSRSGGESGQMPSVRTFGGNLKITF